MSCRAPYTTQRPSSASNQSNYPSSTAVVTASTQPFSTAMGSSPSTAPAMGPTAPRSSASTTTGLSASATTASRQPASLSTMSSTSTTPPPVGSTSIPNALSLAVGISVAGLLLLLVAAGAVRHRAHQTQVMADDHVPQMNANPAFQAQGSMAANAPSTQPEGALYQQPALRQIGVFVEITVYAEPERPLREQDTPGHAGQPHYDQPTVRLHQQSQPGPLHGKDTPGQPHYDQPIVRLHQQSQPPNAAAPMTSEALYNHPALRLDSF